MKIDGLNINYLNYGKKTGKSIVFLHGWNQNIEMMKALSDLLEKDYNIIIVDLPGFGKSTEPKEALTVDDYVEIINKLLLKLKIKEPSLVGHSFGGKISLLYASKYKVDKLIVLGSPFKVRYKKQPIKVKFLKFLKKIPILNKFEEFAKSKIGSTDYKNASAIMREILVKTVNYDITKQVQKIKAPTLIIWGEFDEEVPVSHAKELKSLIVDSGLVILKNSTHYAYLENKGQVAKMIESLIGGK